MGDTGFRLQIRTGSERFEDAPLQDVTWRWLQRAIQYREFRYWKGQKHYPGLYWSSTMRAHVGYESRLELWSALGADFDPHVCFQLSQPFELSEGAGTRRLYHVPDYLLRYDDGRLCVVDVKPASKLAKPKVQAQFAWTRRALTSRGWEYRVESEPDDTYLQNLRFLAGYRRRIQFDQDHVHLAHERLSGPLSFGQAVASVTSICGDREEARAIVLHLLWTRHFRADLSVPLQLTSILEATRDA